MTTKTRPAAAAGWRNRIVGSGEEAPHQLLANPQNWRLHPAVQRNALRGSLDTVGWVQQVMVNRRTGFVVDGHARVEEALSRHETTVRVLYARWASGACLFRLDVSAVPLQDPFELWAGERPTAVCARSRFGSIDEGRPKGDVDLVEMLCPIPL